MTGQLGLPPHDHPPLLRALSPFAGSGPNQFSLERSKTAQDRQHQAAVSGGRICPRVSEGFEPSSFFPNRPQEVQQIARRSRKTIEPGYDQHVTLCEDSHQASQLLSVRPDAADFFLKNLFTIRRL